MLVLVCLFFITYSYASEENIPLTSVIVEDELLQEVKNKYVSGIEHWECDKVYFYNAAVE